MGIRKVGKFKRKPIVEGDSNLVKKDDVIMADSIGGGNFEGAVTLYYSNSTTSTDSMTVIQFPSLERLDYGDTQYDNIAVEKTDRGFIIHFNFTSNHERCGVRGVLNEQYTAYYGGSKLGRAIDTYIYPEFPDYYKNIEIVKV